MKIFTNRFSNNIYEERRYLLKNLLELRVLNLETSSSVTEISSSNL